MEEITIYHYDKDSKDFVGTSKARWAPKELELGEYVPLIPANATTKEPPKEFNPNSETCKLIDGCWTVRLNQVESSPKVLNAESRKGRNISMEARYLLRSTDYHIMQYMEEDLFSKEHTLSDTQITELSSYRDSLRKVISGKATEIPPKPEFI